MLWVRATFELSASETSASVLVFLWPTRYSVPPETFWATNRAIVHNLVCGNFLVLCAATLPIGLDRLGMPVGLQLIAKGGDDERLVAIACAAEGVLGTPRQILGQPPLCRG